MTTTTPQQGSEVRTSAVPAWVDRFLASDPGLNRLRAAFQAVVVIAVAMLAERIFVGLTHAMQTDTHGALLPPAQAAQIAAQHHGVLVIAVMVGAVIGMISAFTGGMFPTARIQLIGFGMMPVLMIAGLALGLALAPYRDASLAMLVVVLAVGAYCRRFGPLGFVGGQMVFMGDFFGFFLDGSVSLSDLGWLSAEVVIGTLVALIAQFTVFHPVRRRDLARMQRSYAARLRDTLDHALRLFDGGEDSSKASADLHRRLVRLNEAALMVDGQLNNPAAIPRGWSAESLHQILFDTELAATNMVRFVESMAGLELPEAIRTRVRTALVAVRDNDVSGAEATGHALLAELRRCGDGPDGVADRTDYVLVHRYGRSVLGYAESQRDFRERAAAARSGIGGAPADPSSAFRSPVVLMAGWLPGSAMVSAQASNEEDPSEQRPWYLRGPRGHIALTPNVRVAIQMAVAVAGAVVFGDLLSGRRFYWAVIAAFITFMGANNTGEQVRKSLYRVAGTMVGVLIGAVRAHLVGQHTFVALAVILVALFFGLYLMRINYAFMVVGITIMVSQLYVQLDEFTNRLLVLRLEETALGAAVAALTVICVLPLRTGRVARLSARKFLEALDLVVEKSVSALGGACTVSEVRAAVRAMDDSYQTLLTTMASLGVPLFDRGVDSRKRFRISASAARNYARNLLGDAVRTQALPTELRTELDVARGQFAASVSALEQWLESGTTEAAYVRSASLFDQVATGVGGDLGSPVQLVLRDLQLIDGALATISASLGLEVRALDTAA